jgi:CRISPR-associated endonuclease Csn1
MARKILGLDLGTTSIGWALVNEAESQAEKSSIIKLGVRVNPLSVDEQQNFEKGKSITTNADRTLKRSMRRNLQRYKLRRQQLIEILIENHFISSESILSETGNRSTFETIKLRAKAATMEISLEQFARVLLMINKKRGYKSSRKAKGTEEGSLIDGMEIAKHLYNEKLTPGQYCYQLLEAGKHILPDFYRTDLLQEFVKVFEKQRTYYPEILTIELQEKLRGKKREAVWAICAAAFKEKGIELVGVKRVGKQEDQKKENYLWRAKGLSEKLDLEQFVIVLQQINSQLNSSSGYLGAISDRSKELFFNKQTVGQYQMSVLEKTPNASLRNMVFYRQDYLDEFNIIWEEQAKYHRILTEELKSEIRDVIIFYQRKLKSQKGLISICEFENHEKELVIDGRKKKKIIGNRVAPRSSPIFQEFKIWQVLNNIEITQFVGNVEGISKNGNIGREALKNEKRELYQEEKELLASVLNYRFKMTKSEVLKLLFKSAKDFDVNFKEIQGNHTNASLFEAFLKIVEVSGHVLDTSKPVHELIDHIDSIFINIGINNEILKFDSSKDLDTQMYYQLWHLLYSFEGDDSVSGNDGLIQKLISKFGFDAQSAKILSNVSLLSDYGSLSSKAIRKILPHLKDGNKFDVACEYAGYRHSKSSLTKEEIENKVYKERLEILPKNSLRNPVVEKILNQMINVVNNITEVYGKPDEIRIELARELKKNRKERESLHKTIESTSKWHEEIKQILQTEFGISNVSRNDIIRYKLYDELKANGYKTLYSNTYISREKLFSKEFDIEHIIPQARLFDDSFSNKTLELRSINIEKGDKTAYDFIKEKYGETGGENSLDKYLLRLNDLFKKEILSRTKFNKLGMTEKEIPDGFINRDLGNTQYIAKFARALLNDFVKSVVSTTGSITERLREDWQLVDIMKELNWEKYQSLGLTEILTKTDSGGNKVSIKRIKDWSKRNDHRHHAMDALTVAFTKRQYIQYLNNLNARSNKGSDVYGIEQKELFRNEKGKLLFKAPFEIGEFRSQARMHLENTLISIKSKNKVLTQNVNIIKKKNGTKKVIQQTPRGQLHNETIYGAQKQYVIKEEKVGASFDEAKISTVAKAKYRNALLKRLQDFNFDPKKAFTGSNSLAKTPIYIDSEKTVSVPEKVKTVSFETVYTIRKEIGPDLKLDKVVDSRIRKILENRLLEFKGDYKKAFVNLDENPIWANEEKGIAIKRVTITENCNAEALHSKRDKNGKLILDENGKELPVDFINTASNHHVAVFRNKEGQLFEKVVSFFEAVARRNSGLPVIDKVYRNEEELPVEDCEFIFSMKRNEYFVFPNEKSGFNPFEIDLLDPNNYGIISPNLFRVQKFSFKNYVFRHHLETSVADFSSNLKGITWIDFRSSKGLDKIIKVRINHIGMIVSVGEF